jgi:hypothetical protein
VTPDIQFVWVAGDRLSLHSDFEPAADSLHFTSIPEYQKPFFALEQTRQAGGTGFAGCPSFSLNLPLDDPLFF